MLSFPKRNSRIVASSTPALATGTAYLSLGRLPVVAHRLVVATLRTPLSRTLVAPASFEPACGWDTFRAATVGHNASVVSWAFLASPWGKPRVHALGLDSSWKPTTFLTMEPVDAPHRPLPVDWTSFRVPQELQTCICQGWRVVETEVMPAYHRPCEWDLDRLISITKEISRRLRASLPRPAAVPTDYQPAHGDFVPWNVRTTSPDSVWVIDWEDACWAPPQADLVRFAVALRSLRRRGGDDLEGTRRLLAAVPRVEVARAADFWLAHRNLTAGSLTERPATPARLRRTVRENRLLEGLRR